MPLRIFELDPQLRDVSQQIWDRVNGYKWWKGELDKNEGGLVKFAEGYKQFGWIRTDDGYTFREWLPNAMNVWLIGEWNGWQNTQPLTNEGFGRWKLDIKDKPDGSPGIPHKSQLKIRIETGDGQWHDRVPAWTKLAWQDHSTMLYNGVFWEPPKEERYVFKHPRPEKPVGLKIYEAHVGMGSFDPKVATYLEFAQNVLPRIKRLGYNAVQLMAVAEHAHYGCFGYHVTSFFAPASRSGTPEELKEMIDVAHGLGIQVLVDLVHAHCSSNTLDGIAQQDGTDHCYTHGGEKGHHSEWDSKLFHFTKYEVMRFLLSNVKWWLEEYRFDGFRFDGVTSMLYQSHGIGKGYTGGYHEYFGGDADIDSHIYLMLANDLIHQVVPSAVTVGEDVSGMPTLCRPVDEGGFGFDYRLAMAIPDMFIKLLKETPDDAWDMEYICHTLTNRRWLEAVIAYVESHDQAIVGDKTLAFWLMDAEMYTGMSIVNDPQASLCVDRGLSLHKMIRLLVLGLGGEGYLSFMGNEFGHPEWIDFPREENGWSHHLCRRRWDLADADHLRYQYFQCFDELMQALENRYKWLGSSHQYVSVKNSMDKVIVFEKGDLLFVFNLNPCQSFENYTIGTNFSEPLRTALDTDEGRFGGHMRLEHGHAHPFPIGMGVNGMPHSVTMYLPARTAQVLVKASLLEGGIKIFLTPRFLVNNGLISPNGVKLIFQDESEFPFDEEGCVHIEDHYAANFRILAPSGKLMPCRSNYDAKDPTFRIFFPGEYTIEGLGYFETRADAQCRSPPEDINLEAECRKEMTAMRALKAAAAKKEAPKKAPEEAKKKEEKEKEEEDDADFENFPTALSDAGMGVDTGMARVSSLSCFDTLLSADETVQLREKMDAVAQDEDRPARYGARHLSTPVVIVSSEMNPWSKTGGLAMVAGSYAYEFAMRGHRVMAISPRYEAYENTHYIGYAKVWLDGREIEVKYFHQHQKLGDEKGCDFIFIEHDCFRRGSGLYGDVNTGKEYEDNLFRFALLSLAAAEAPLLLNLGGSTFGQDVMFIANDWQTGLLPVYLVHKYRRHGTYKNARCMLVIHNLGYQGKYRLKVHPIDRHLGLPAEAIQDMQGEDLNMGTDCLNLLQAGVKTCDRVLTVSPNYCNEIQSPEGGQGMHEILQGKGAMLRMGGILNGISDEWSPLTDKHLPKNYGPKDFVEGKAVCKKELQASLGLHQDPNLVLLGFCGRLCFQKGVHLIMEALDWLMQDEGNGVTGRVQLVVMGKGDPKIAEQVRQAEGRYRGRVCGYVGFDPAVEHKMMGACDFILMPSQYEPCGLPQMYAQQYATIPIVHETGGLKDSVKGLWEEQRDRSTATGFLFSPFEPNPLKEKLWQALSIFMHNKGLHRQMQTNAIKSDFYWPRALDEYERHIDWTLEAEPCR